MPRFFVKAEQFLGNMVFVHGADAAHIARSLRMQVGEHIIVCDQNGTDYDCIIVSVTAQEVKLEWEQKYPTASEPKVQIHLFQALPKADKLEFIVQKATELGACSITPVLTEYCISRPKADAMQRKQERLQKIALEAAKQSGRGKVPEICSLLSFHQALMAMKQSQTALMYYEHAQQTLHNIRLSENSVAVFIGSEGGFSHDEVLQAQEVQIPLLSLGKRILRCETAPIAALATILYQLGE